MATYYNFKDVDPTILSNMTNDEFVEFIRRKKMIQRVDGSLFTIEFSEFLFVVTS